MTALDVKTPPEKRAITTQPRFSDRVFRQIVTAGGLSSLVILSLILLFLLFQGYETIRTQGSYFLTGSQWTANLNQNNQLDLQSSKFGIAAMLIGTLVCSLIAVTIAVPLSVLAAIYLTFYVPNSLKKIMVSVIDLMAAFPSILFGLWGFFILAPLGMSWAKFLHKYFDWIPFFKMQSPFYERSPFIAGLVLSVMIIPIVTAISREIFSQTPLDRIQAAYALGATKFGMIKAVAIPYARSGIVGSAMLGLGRAMGETVAVYTVLNIVYKINFQILIGAGGNVASMILLKFGEATQGEVKALMAAGLVLFAVTLIVNSIADFIVARTGSKGR